MDWRLKCLSFHIFDKIRFGDDAYYYAQKFVTRRHHRVLNKPFGSDKIFPDHATVFRRNFGALEDAVYLEFGAGRYLFDIILNYCHGINKQIVLDIKPLAKPELINQVILRFKEIESTELARRPEFLLGANFVEELREHYGIEYLAPVDARHVDMPDGSVDIIATTNTLEHVPRPQLMAIMKECHRLCNHGGIVSMKIDYTDHYSHTDKSIGPYNFLSFGEGAWKLLNPRNHYQNRLRHIDYIKIFIAAGFQVIEEHYEIPEDAQAALSSIKLDKRFRNVFCRYHRDDEYTRTRSAPATDGNNEGMSPIV